METRERIHQLVDELPETELGEIERLLESRRPPDPLSHTLAAAPHDNEAESEDEAAAMKQAYEDIARGNLVSHDQLLRRLSGPASPG